ncbi:hypothetical protein [Phenylobacterium sp. SCN 70-31]|uniref:hypothetical protein n=1 Tax=Phenylobacterium sp. SCN 70-31 TaxID=1660129 RepID=UPI00086DE332|nr:hypothetical protein [Phenylobacterium sp. SCN 70-31]ODT87835.1 MAG: hypothetical protein ABS78_09630 [Phenylobacterium sp. SCN 70-31]
MTGVKLKLILVGSLSALALAGCGGADNVASPGEGAFPPSGGGTTPPGNGGGTPQPGQPAADCPTGFSNVGLVANGTLRACQLPTLILGNLVVPNRAGTVYAISGRTDVGQDRGADPNNPIAGAQQGILTIEPGVRLFGSGGLDYLNIVRGSQIFAEGTATNPIIFTSRSNIDGASGADLIGQWGGIVISGRAPIASCPAGTTPPNINCVATFEGGVSLYGGNSPTDNSGRLRYIQVRYPGFEVQPNRELNGITFNGVGSGTTVEYVQVHNSSDDGIEFFGGTVNAKRVVITGADDDSIDTDEGWRGGIQYLIVRQRANGGDRAFEMSSAGVQASLNSQPKIANYTAIGSTRTGAGDVQILNTGTGGRFINGIHVSTNPTTACLDVDDTSTVAAAPRWDSVVFACAIAFREDTNVTAAQVATLFNAGANNSSTHTSTLSGFVNGSNEMGRVATNPQAIYAFFDNVTYIGAVRDASDTWWQGWTCGLSAGSSC